MNFRTHSTLYFAAGIVFIALETLGATLPEIIAKTFIIPLLIWLYASHLKGAMKHFHRMIIAALIFSWGGDMLLQLSQFNETLFLAGVGSFLITQLIYLVMFFSTKGPNVLFFRRIYLLIPVAAYGILIIRYIADGLGDMLVPIIVYTVAILTMLLGALNRELKVNRQSYILVLLGAVLFILSDSLIMINRIKMPFDLARIIIMSTYITAQYLIAVGCLKQFNIKLR
jgi:uncharacterized membrane protein YhhN